MNPLFAQLEDIQAVLHPLAAQPDGPCWNRAEITGLSIGAEPAAAAVLVGLVPRPHGLQILLTRRTGGLRNHAGQVSFPGGRVEPSDENACAAALRETQEEIGIEPARIQPIGYLDPLATITGFRIVPLVAAIAADHVLRIDAGEVDEVFEVPFAYLMTTSNLQPILIDVDGRPRRVLQFVDRGEPGQRIWGASTSILLNLRQRLETMR